jgi:hypothetical protein
MLPTPSDVHVNAPLTQISIAYRQDQSRFVADIDKIDTIIFSHDIRYNGVKNTGAKSFRDLLDGKKAPPLFPTGSTGSRLYT